MHELDKVVPKPLVTSYKSIGRRNSPLAKIWVLALPTQVETPSKPRVS